MARSRYRSVSYDLEASLALARAVAAAGGDTSPWALAVALGYRSTRNGAFRSRLASARRFGLVAGRGHRVLLSERGQAALSSGRAGEAKVAAFYDVPLFRAVAQSTTGVLPDVEDLADVLVADFGEDPTKARRVAVRLTESAVSAGVLAASGPRRFQVLPPLDSTVELGKGTSKLFIPVVRSSGSTVSAARRAETRRRGRPVSHDVDSSAPYGNDDEDSLWLDESVAPQRRRGPRSRAGIVAAAACLAVLAVPVGLLLSGGSTGQNQSSGPAERTVIAALGTTVDSGSFDIAYHVTDTRTSSTTTTSSCQHQPSTVPSVPQGLPSAGQGATASPLVLQVTSPTCHGTTGRALSITGQGIIDTDPFGMVATTDVPGLGNVVIHDNGSTVWEQGGATYGTAGGPSSSGSTLSSFSTLVEGTLGKREGATAMEGLASPTGYLDLAQSEISGATNEGTSTVDGTTVTVYKVSANVLQDPTPSGLTPQEVTTIKAADAVLKQAGFTAVTTTVSVDGSGFIRRFDMVRHFGPSEKVTITLTLSNFGCAGTVLMPGQTGTGTPPAGCVSPDTGVATTTTAPTAPTTTTITTTVPTTLAPAAATTTTTVAPSTTTLVAPVTSPSTTVPPSTLPTTVSGSAKGG